MYDSLILRFIVVFATFSLTARSFGAADSTVPTPDERVVLIGNTLIERMADYGYFETEATSRRPDRDITFRNLGWSGDTVEGRARIGFGPAERSRSGWQRPNVDARRYGFEKLIGQVQAQKPTTILVGYGMNAALETADHEQAFRDGLVRLLDRLDPMGARVVLLSPIPYATVAPPLPDPTERNRRLARLTAWLSETATRRGYRFVDAFTPFRRIAEQGSDADLTDNGIHLNARGYWRLARILETGLGPALAEWNVHLTGAARTVAAAGTTIAGLSADPDGLHFDLTDERLPASPSPDGATSPRTLRIDDLEPGRYRLSIDGMSIRSAAADEWARGVALDHGPEFDQSEALRQTIIEKNRLFFYRSRPQNETYIYLFRRHERGHHSKEIERFDALIRGKERDIAGLRVPKSHRYELVRLEAYPDHEVPSSIPAPDLAAELEALQVAEGFEINLFASDPMIANPIQINWDADGRLWVATSTTYPHLMPGEEANDRIVILEDVDQDGRADRFTLFADGLLVPHSVLPGHGGAYVAESTRLLHLRDTDGDGKADARRILFSGFGNADVHHMIHSLSWGPGGNIYFLQSLYINSYVETLWGVRRLQASGIWRFRPETLRLEVMSRGLVNPWGHAFDRWGQSFETDGAGSSGITYTFPGAAHRTAHGAKRVLPELNQGTPKYCGLEILSGRHLPEAWRGSLLTNDFRANRISRFELADDGSGYASQHVETIVYSTHRSFRPVAIRMGPDGAIYIVDWYNPVIDHGEVDFQHPNRDHAHGRIWRLTAKGRPLVTPPKLAGAPIEQLLDALKLPEAWTRGQARRQLAERDASEVVPALTAWVARLDPHDDDFEHHRLEALWVCQSLRSVQPELLQAVLGAGDFRARAAAVRVLAHWHAELPDAVDRLTDAVADEHPRVRLEAVNALRRIPSVDAATVALRALDQPMDEFLDYAVWLTARELQREWLPAFQAGRSVFDDNRSHLAFALGAIEDPAALRPLVDLYRQGGMTAAERQSILDVITSVGGPDELDLVLDLALSEVATNPTRTASLLAALEDAARRNRQGPKSAARIVTLLDTDHESVRILAAHLAGRWQVEPARARLIERAGDAALAQPQRHAAARALAWLGGAESARQLRDLCAPSRSIAVRITAVAALVTLDPTDAAAQASGVLGRVSHDADATLLFEAFVNRKGGGQALAQALNGKTLPTRVAAAGIRVAGASGRDLSSLIETLTTAGSLEPVSEQLVATERARFLADVLAQGDPTRGELVYRRASLMCAKCHAIGGAGGRIGPDLASLGGSAQVDHVLESLLDPSAKIKEGYQTQTVFRSDGTVVSGVVQRKTNTDLLLRDAEDVLLTIPLSEIDQMGPGSLSLMPTGLTAPLRRDELVDLVRFLSALGKRPTFTIAPRRWVRRWRVLQPLTTHGGPIPETAKLLFDEEPSAAVWQPAYSTVAGALPLGDVPELPAARDQSFGAARFDLEVTTPGRVALRFDRPADLRAWVGPSEFAVTETSPLELSRGRHTITLLVNLRQRRAPLRIELVDVPESPARARIVSGP